MNEKMDEGDIIYQEKTEIEKDETTGELWDRLKEIGANLLIKTLKDIENNNAPRIPQGKDFTMAPMLKKEISQIDWKNEAKEIKNKVRGLNPIMGAYRNDRAVKK
jgi:methionyl-tRNA formyltransferase